MHVRGCCPLVRSLMQTLNHPKMPPGVEQLFDTLNAHVSPALVFKLGCKYTQMAYQKVTVMKVWSLNLPVVTHIQL